MCLSVYTELFSFLYCGSSCDVCSQSDDDSSETEAYFADPNRPGSTPRPHAYQTDEEGYVLRPNIMDESTRPAYLIPVGSADGVWGMMKRLGRFRGEGWPSLWKGKDRVCFLLPN